MADDPPALPRKKKLPPVSPKAKESDGTSAPKKPVRKKKKPVEGEVNEAATVPAEGTPRKKKKPAASTAGSTGTPTKQENGEAPATTTPKKRKKKKPATDNAEEPPASTRSGDSQALEEDVTGSKKSLITKETGTPMKKMKKKVKKKTATPTPRDPDHDDFLDQTLAGDLTALEEDIVSPRSRTEGDGQEDDDDDVRQPYSTESAVLKSQPLQKIFIETDSGFKGENRSKMVKRIAEEKKLKADIAPEQKKSTIEFALGTHRFFQTVLLFLHGLTAGISMWQITLTYILLYFDHIDFIEHYQKLALPVQCMFYLLLVLCVVSACDRFDISSVNRRFLLQSLSLQTGTVAVFIYLAALIVSLCTANLEDRMNLYYVNSTLWQDYTVGADNVKTWQNLNTARCVLAILGWIVIAIVPNTDRLADNLRKGDDNILGDTAELASLA